MEQVRVESLASALNTGTTGSNKINPAKNIPSWMNHIRASWFDAELVHAAEGTAAVLANVHHSPRSSNMQVAATNIGVDVRVV